MRKINWISPVIGSLCGIAALASGCASTRTTSATSAEFQAHAYPTRTVVTQEELRRTGYTNLGQALKTLVPSVQ